MTTSSLGIKSSMFRSSTSNPMDVLLSSPYFSDMVIISFRMTPSKSFSSARIARSSLIFSINSLYSFSNFSRSKPVRVRSLISTMAWDWASVSWNRSINPAFASWVLSEPRIILITSSMWSKAINNPSKIWALSSALFSSYFVLLVTTSFWWSR